jgi:8-oxo-dGTP pyrophosphatase MutT (NUDIX family)
MNLLDALGQALVGLGCPASKSVEMATQLDKRAHQLAAAKGRSYEESLGHLLKLMAGGWAAQTGETPSSKLQAPNSDSTPAIRPWPTLSSRSLADYRIFRVRADLKVNPRTGGQHDLFAIECVNWVNVVPITTDNRVVMVEQFRHGSNTIELEIPGGMMDPHETDPITAGQRELREETGYEGTHAKLIGSIFPNPAIQTNTCYTLLVEGCEALHEVEFDATEDLAVRLVPVADIPELIRSGRIRHALVVVALTHYLLQRDGSL